MVCLGTELPTNMNNASASHHKCYILSCLHKKEATNTDYNMFGCCFVTFTVVKTIHFLPVNNMENLNS
jgi:hypothetical protein